MPSSTLAGIHGRDPVRPEAGVRAVAAARRVALLALGAWFVAAVVAGALGMVNQPGRPPVALLGFVALPIVLFVAADAASPSFRAFANRIPLSWLVGSNVWRFVGLGFIVAAVRGALPMGFGIPEGVGDVIAALGALLLLPSVRRGDAPRGWLLAWNAFGFLDLVSALTLGLLFSESALGVLHTATSNTTPMVTFPVSLIPTFFVPLFLLVHLLLFRRISRIRLEGGSHAVSR
jgi:hypothetical protein